MCNASFWQLFLQYEHDKSDEERAQKHINKISPRLWVLSRTKFHPLTAGDFHENEPELEQC